ncbi:MAG: alpha-2-macroglobulin family protein, partial [Bacteroidota bacterium]
TDAQGRLRIRFTAPEALTRWKFRTLAHTRDLKSALLEREVRTQKRLMVQPHLPRFFRDGDQITVTAKISALTEKGLAGKAYLEFFDAATMQPVDSALGNRLIEKPFQVKARQSTTAAWQLEIPNGLGAVVYRIRVEGEDPEGNQYSDGEEAAVPVLSNRMLVTEGLPMAVRPGTKRTFTHKKLRNHQSATLKHHRLSLEFTSNPAWYAVQSLPYLMEFPYECAEQTFHRYYANALASYIANAHPRIRKVFERWKQQPDALKSNLEKRQDLKSLLLQETPWVLQAQDESERKKRLGLLLDLTHMAAQKDRAIGKLQKLQAPTGGFSWFPGMPESVYMTRLIVAGLGHLHHLGITEVREDRRTENMLKMALVFLDARVDEAYQRLKNMDMTDLSPNHTGSDLV